MKEESHTLAPYAAFFEKMTTAGCHLITENCIWRQSVRQGLNITCCSVKERRAANSDAKVVRRRNTLIQFTLRDKPYWHVDIRDADERCVRRAAWITLSLQQDGCLVAQQPLRVRVRLRLCSQMQLCNVALSIQSCFKCLIHLCQHTVTPARGPNPPRFMFTGVYSVLIGLSSG